MSSTQLKGTQIKDADITGSDIADDSVTNPKLSNVSQNTIKGRVSSGSGDPEDLTPSQVASVLAGTFHPRVFSTTSLATLTPETSAYDYFELTAQAQALNIANQSTTAPSTGDKMLIVIKSNISAWGITYGNSYVAKAGFALPSTTVANKVITLGFIYSAAFGGWNLVAVGQEA